MYTVFIKFIICAGIIVVAGRRVARYGDVIAEKTGLGGLWVGLILVSVATSLPELFAGVGSILFVKVPDLTVGNLFGANSYNLLNIALLALIYRARTRGRSLLADVSKGELMVAGSSLVPLTIAALGILCAVNGIYAPQIAGVDAFSIAILAAYLGLTYLIFRFEKTEQSIKKEEKLLEEKYGDISLKKAYKGYAIAAVAIIASGIWLSYIGDEISRSLALEQSFTGSLFLGLATTLPEITVSIAALLIGAREIAIANMFGSNLFNMAILFIDDALYREAPLFRAVSSEHILTACIVMVMTTIVIIAMAIKPKVKPIPSQGWNGFWYIPALVIIFCVGTYINFIK
ncbi:MAG: hypothetical protein ISS91_00390 [Candidatus Omnitrophica bacterium]|nr:hypothetical protein [Candidatus Omnitrophota bacterium]